MSETRPPVIYRNAPGFGPLEVQVGEPDYLSMKLAIWILWSSFAAYWVSVSIYSVWKLRTDPSWQPRALDLYASHLGLRLSTRAYVILICLGAALALASGFWFPRFMIE